MKNQQAVIDALLRYWSYMLGLDLPKLERPSSIFIERSLTLINSGQEISYDLRGGEIQLRPFKMSDDMWAFNPRAQECAGGKELANELSRMLSVTGDSHFPGEGLHRLWYYLLSADPEDDSNELANRANLIRQANSETVEIVIAGNSRKWGWSSQKVTVIPILPGKSWHCRSRHTLLQSEVLDVLSASTGI